MNTPSSISHKGPHPGMLALLYTILFSIGLYPVTALYKQPYWPGPWESASVIVSYFQNYGSRVLFCIVMHLGAFVCFGLFAVTIVSRLRFLGVKAAGTYIALLGGFLVLANVFAGTMVMWALLHPGVVDHPPTLLALYYLSFALGGPGFSVPMGPFPGRGKRHLGLHEAFTAVARHLRSCACLRRGAESVPLGISEAVIPHPAGSLPRIYLAHCHRISAA
jgi:hypothetical protein